MKLVLRKIVSFMLMLALSFTLISMFALTEANAASKTHLKKASIVMTTGATYQQKLLTANNKIISASKVKWSSNNNKIAKISKKGKVTAIKEGTATLKAKYKGKTYNFKVKVKDADLYYTPGTTCVVGGTMQMCMWGAGGKIDVNKVKWKSSNRSIITVNSKGVVKGIAPGTAKVYATYLNHRYSCKISVVWTTFENVSLEIPYASDKGLVFFKYTTNYPKGVNVELGSGSQIVKVFHKNQGKGNNRYASIYCYPNATGQVELKVYTVSEPNSYFLFKLNFKNGEFIGEGDLPGTITPVKPPTYSEAGIPNLGHMTDSLSIAFEGAMDDNTMAYVYNLCSTKIETMAICATYMDFLVDDYGWKVYKVENTTDGGMMYTLYNNRYTLGMEWRPLNGQYQITIMLMRG